MDEAQPHGVEALALEPRHGLFRPVDGVSQDGVAQVGHVDPDLVGAAGLQTAADVGEAGVAGDDLPMGDGPAAIRDHRHLLPVPFVPSNGGVHGAGVLPEVAHHDALIGPGQAVVRELGGELLVGEVVLRRDDEARGVPVDAVDDAGALLPADAGEGVPAVVEEGVDQRPVGVARSGMHHQPLGLIDDDDVSVLVENVQGDVLGDERRFVRLRQCDGHGLAAPEAVVFRQGLPFRCDPALRQEPGCGGAGQLLPPGTEPGVHALAGVLRRDREGQDAHAPGSLSRLSQRKR